MTDASQDITSNPGKILKTARDELKYSVEHVAHELHLRASVVTAMEDEDYEQFSSDVFLKGYFRSYCRLVHLHEERMVELLDKQLGSRKQEREDAVLLEKKIKQTATRKKAFVVASVMLIAIGLIAYIYTSLLPVDSVDPVESGGKAGVVLDERVQEKNAQTDANDEASKPEPLSKKELLSKNERLSKEIQNQALEPKQLSVSSSLPAPIVVKPAAVKQVEVKQTKAIKTEVGETVAAQSTPIEANETKPSQVYSFEATFSGDCWFKLKNGLGKTPFAALKRSGDQVSYSGLGPFDIVLGDATKATIVFQSNSVNLKPYTARNGRAQFTLGETRKDQ